MSEAATAIEPTASAEPAAGEPAESDIPSVAELAELMGMTLPEQKPEEAQEAAEEAEKPEAASTEGNEADAGTISETAGETTAEGTEATKPGPAAGEADAAEKPAEEEKKEEPAQPDPLKKQIEELQAEIAALKAAKPEPKPEPAVVPARAEFFGLDALTLQEVKAAEQVKRWAEANPEGGEVAGADGQPETISPARVQALLSESNGILAAARQAGRERFTQAQRQADEYVREHYPTLADKKSEDYAAYERLIARMPQLKEAPDVKVQVGRLLRGFRAEQEEIKQRLAAAQPKAPAKETAVPRAPVAGVVPRAAVVRTKPQTSQRDTQLAELRKRAEAGDQAAAEQYFAMQG